MLTDLYQLYSPVKLKIREIHRQKGNMIDCLSIFSKQGK
jgi:hypothetical protein